MYIIVDSGSTKSDWLVVNEGAKNQYSTPGLNPFFHDRKFMVAAINGNEELMKVRNQVSAVYFYGAGCSHADFNVIVEDALKEVFTSAKVVVDHDLMGCALATYENEPSISCILGTGSNSCYYNGKELSQERPAIGYILGDEASGAYFGKELLRSFLYHLLPKHLEQDLIQDYAFTKESIFKQVYMQPDANVYLASLMKFISKHHQEPFFKEMIYQGMKTFIEIHVCCFPGYNELPVHFIGSIAYIFKAELERAARDSGIRLGKVIQKPIDGLMEYHEKEKNRLLTKK